MIVVSDFDGTLTIDDVTAMLWDAHLPYDWRATLLPPTYAGEWTPLQMIARGYHDIPIAPEALLAELRPRVRLRPGLAALAERCRARGWPFVVVSHGLTFYIHELLPPGIPVVAFDGTFVDGRWRVTLPQGFDLPPGEDFKRHVVAGLRAWLPGQPAVYLGDGRLDLVAALACDRIFAARDSTLARLVPEAGREAILFDTLDEVMQEL
jgi:2-hydroxy-3-keto-5-methylthiopentenyl-1-phosphate phosphatase